MTEQTEVPPSNVSYVCPSQHTLRFGVVVNGVRKQITFVHHKCVVDAATAEVIDELLQVNPGLGGKIVKMDMQAAEMLARQHMATQRPAAIKGTTGSTLAKLREKTVIDEMRQQGASEEDLDKLQQNMSGEGLVLTETVDVKPPTALNLSKK